MKILFLDQFSEIGGAQLCLLDLLDGVRERGWQARVALPGNGPLAARLHARGVGADQLSCGPFRSGAKRVRDYVKFTLDLSRQRRAVANLLTSGSFDLVYVNGPRLLPAAALATGGRIPLVFHAHNHINGAAAVRLAGWSIGHSHATVIACSDFAAAPIRRYLMPERLHIIPNGTADAGYRQRRFDRWKGCRVGMIGRIAPEKGHLDFVRAASMLTSLIPNVRFTICGAAEPRQERYASEVRALAGDLPIEFLGWRDDIPAVLADLDLLVLPSRQEGLPRVLLEAYSAGVVPVGYPAGGVAEAIDDDITGYLVPERSYGALAMRIHELITGDPQRLRDVAANARRVWQRRYTIAVYQKRITDLMQRVAGCRVEESETISPPVRK
ncbi:MAG: glycosyltransferase family 4 protein [Bryobacteraceae bacterium]